MFGLVEFFGSPAWTYAVLLGTALCVLVVLYFTEGDRAQYRALLVGIVLVVYFLLVLTVRGIALSV